MNHDSSTFGQDLDTFTRSASGHEEITNLRVPGLTILCHPDVRRIGERSALTALVSGRVVSLSRLEPMFSIPGATRRRPLADPHLSRRPLELMPTGEGGIRLSVSGTKTRVEAEGQAVAEGRDFSKVDLESGVVLLLAERVVLFLHDMDPLPPRDVPGFDLVGESTGMMYVRQQISRAAEVDLPVLLRGETGTGKELVARAIHQASRRRAEPWVAVNMGAIPLTLAAAELFGAVKGAFTGADRKRIGFFAQADGGTFFLDEIGETPLEVQALLLRALETRVIQPVGSEKSQRVDVRIVAATDAALENEIEVGRFREPLLHRLNVFSIRLPALRQRRDDIGLLLLHFLQQEFEQMGEVRRLDGRHAASQDLWLPAPLVARLATYPWPGNVRQLRNVARQLVIHNRGKARLRITPEIEELLEPAVPSPSSSLPSSPSPSPSPSSPSSSSPSSWIQSKAPDPARANAEKLVEEAGMRAVLRTLVSTDLVEGTSLMERLGDQRAFEVMTRCDRIARGLLAENGGHEIDKSEAFLLLFDRPVDAVAFAVAFHQALENLSEELDVELKTRVGIHLGEILLRRNEPSEIAHGAKALEVEGLAKPMAVGLMSLAIAGQTLLTRHAYDLAQQASPRDDLQLATAPVRWLSHGEYPIQGASGSLEVFEVGIDGKAPMRAPASPLVSGRVVKAGPTGKRYRSPTEVDEEELLAALRQHDFKLQPTAAALGISRTSLYALIEKSNRIRKSRDLNRQEIENASTRLGGDLDSMAAELEVSRKGLRRRMTELGV